MVAISTQNVSFSHVFCLLCLIERPWRTVSWLWCRELRPATGCCSHWKTEPTSDCTTTGEETRNNSTPVSRATWSWMTLPGTRLVSQGLSDNNVRTVVHCAGRVSIRHFIVRSNLRQWSLQLMKTHTAQLSNAVKLFCTSCTRKIFKGTDTNKIV